MGRIRKETPIRQGCLQSKKIRADDSVRIFGRLPLGRDSLEGARCLVDEKAPFQRWVRPLARLRGSREALAVT